MKYDTYSYSDLCLLEYIWNIIFYSVSQGFRGTVKKKTKIPNQTTKINSSHNNNKNPKLKHKHRERLWIEQVWTDPMYLSRFTSEKGGFSGVCSFLQQYKK